MPLQKRRFNVRRPIGSCSGSDPVIPLHPSRFKSSSRGTKHAVQTATRRVPLMFRTRRDRGKVGRTPASPLQPMARRTCRAGGRRGSAPTSSWFQFRCSSVSRERAHSVGGRTPRSRRRRKSRTRRNPASSTVMPAKQFPTPFPSSRTGHLGDAQCSGPSVSSYSVMTNARSTVRCRRM